MTLSPMKWLVRKWRKDYEKKAMLTIAAPVQCGLAQGLLGFGQQQLGPQLGAAAAQTPFHQQVLGQALGLGQPWTAFGAAQRVPLSERELPCPRCYQPLYYRMSFDVLGCNRCQLWVTRELAQVSYIEEWGHWADA